MKLTALYKNVTTAFQFLQFARLSGIILLSILFVQLSFSAEEISQYEWILFLANSVSFFWAHGLRNALMSYFPKLQEIQQKKLFFNLSIFFILLSLGISVLLYVLDYGEIINTSDHIHYLSLFVLFNIPSTLSEHILILKQRAVSLFSYGILFYGGYFFLLGFYALKYLDVEHVLFALVVWAGLRFLYLLFLISRYGEIRIDRQLIRHFFIFGLPLIIHVLVGGGMEYVDGFLVKLFFEDSDFTYFRFGVRELPVNTIFISSLVTAIVPLAVVDLSSSLVEVKRKLNGLMNWLFPLSIILIWVSPMAYQFFYDSSYIISARIFNVYLLIICSRILLPQVLIYAKHDNKILMWVGILELVINLVLSILLLQYFGLLGLAFATVIAYMVQKIILVYYTQNKYDIQLSSYLNIKKYIIFSILLYTCFVVSELMIESGNLWF